MYCNVQLIFLPILFSIFDLLAKTNQSSTIKNGKSEKNIRVNNGYTEKEVQAIDKFRSAVANTTILSNGEYYQSDGFIIRWLRASDLNVDKAKEMLIESQEWREANNISGILNETFGFRMTHQTCLQAGFDYEGSPVTILRSGGVDIRKYIFTGHGEKLIRLLTQCLEGSYVRIREAVNGGAKNVSQAVCIADLSGYTTKQQGCIQCIGKFLQALHLFDKYYPGLTKLFVVINMPSFMKTLFDATLGIAPMDLRRTPMRVFGANRNEWVPFLLKLIPADQLYSDYGGTLRIQHSQKKEQKMAEPEVHEYSNFV